MYVYVSEHDSILTVHQIELKYGMYITGYRRTNFIDFGEYRMIFFYRSARKISYTLWPMESNSVKGSSI